MKPPLHKADFILLTNKKFAGVTTEVNVKTLVRIMLPVLTLWFYNLKEMSQKSKEEDIMAHKVIYVYHTHKPSWSVGPGLAQLVERLTHRYSESTSSNPSNLTSATVCWDRTVWCWLSKRLTYVVPEVDLGQCTLHSPPQKANKAEPTVALKPSGDVTRNPKQGYQWPPKRTCVSSKNLKKTKQHILEESSGTFPGKFSFTQKNL